MLNKWLAKDNFFRALVVLWALSWVVEWWIIVITLMWITNNVGTWVTVPPIFVVTFVNFLIVIKFDDWNRR